MNLRTFKPELISNGDILLVAGLNTGIVHPCEVITTREFKGRYIFLLCPIGKCPVNWPYDEYDGQEDFQCDAEHCDLPINLIMADIMTVLETI